MTSRSPGGERVHGSRAVLAVRDLDAATRHLATVLGFAIETVDDPGWRIARLGAFTVMLGGCPDAAPAAAIGDHSYVAYVEMRGVDGYHDAVVARGGDVCKPIRDEPWGMREFGVRTPEGHRMMFAEPVASARLGARAGRKIDYLHPDVPDGLPVVDVPVRLATPEALAGVGELVDGFDARPIDIVRWPDDGWRPVDDGTGDEGGTVEGAFTAAWDGPRLLGVNAAVGGRYVWGWCDVPGRFATDAAPPHDHVVLWHANHHPDGGQLFFPVDGDPFVAVLAPPAVNVRLEDFVAWVVPAGKGLYVPPRVWHEGIVPLGERARFRDRQGAVHARVSCDFAVEHRRLLRVSLATARRTP